MGRGRAPPAVFGFSGLDGMVVGGVMIDVAVSGVAAGEGGGSGGRWMRKGSSRRR